MTAPSRRKIVTSSARKREAGNKNGEEGLPVLSLSGKFASQVTVIPRTNSTLLMGLGTVEGTDRTVMVPFLETVLAGTTHGEIGHMGEVDDDGLSEVLSCVLSLDNAIWMQFDMVRDTRQAVGDLTAVVKRDAMEGRRLSQALHFAERLREEADGLVTALKLVAEEP